MWEAGANPLHFIQLFAARLLGTLWVGYVPRAPSDSKSRIRHRLRMLDTGTHSIPTSSSFDFGTVFPNRWAARAAMI